MNTYRVDRNQSKVSTPCGMNSILYIGDNANEAKRAYDAAKPGLGSWNQPNETYGVTYAVWDSSKRDYVVKRWKGFD